RELVGGMFAELAPKVSTEDAKKIRELVRNSAIRADRRLAPRELEAVAQSATEIRDALAPLRKELAKATGSKKGAITKHLNRVLDGLLTGTELNEEDAALVAGVDAKRLETARGLGKGLLADLLAQAETDTDDAAVPELAHGL